MALGDAMGEYAGGAPPPQSKDDDELETLWADYAGYCTSWRNWSGQGWLHSIALERLRSRPSGVLGVLTAGLIGGLPPLVVAFVVAASVGQWSSPSLRGWVIASLWIAVTYMAWALFGDASVVQQFAMDRALTKPADLRTEIAWAHKWITPWWTTVFSASYALVCLVVIWLSAGAQGFRSVPAGTIAMLVFVFYESGDVAYQSVLWVFGLRISSKLDYRVSWPSPLDSPWVRPALRGQAQNEVIRGVAVTGNIVVVAVLLSLESPLLLSATAVLLFTGYATILSSVVAARVCFHRIITRAKVVRMAEIQARIDAFGELHAELDEVQSGELSRLVELCDVIGRAPTDLRARDMVTRLGASLVLPTITFGASVVAQEYFGRWAGKFLP